MKIRSLAVLSLPLQLSLLTLTAAGASAQAPSAAELTKTIDALAAEQLAKPGGVGLSIAVAQRGKILLAKGYGLADAELAAPADAQTMFRIASITKEFTASIVMRLVERKQLALDDELGKYLPDFPLQGHTVTLRQMLQHTSGIHSYTEISEDWMKVWPLELSHDELIAFVKDAPFDFEPGSDWHYSNTNYYLLGMVIEKVTGQSYAEALQAELCEPLGLTRTRYDSNRDLIKNRAQGYQLDGEQLVNDQMFGMSQPGGAGGILSTAGDLVRFSMALTSGQVVKPETFAQMRQSAVLPSGHDSRYGLGLRTDELAGQPRMWHAGGIFGFTSISFWLPDADLHVAVLSNSEAIVAADIADAIAYAALGVEPSAVKDEPIPADLIARLSGDYAFTGIGMDAKVFGEDGQLKLQASGQEAFRLLWQGGLEFRAEFDSEVKLVFAADAKSVALYQNHGKADGVRQ